MKTRISLGVLGVAFAVAVAGCGSKSSEDIALQSGKMRLFKEGQGVWFSDETKRLFALEMADVIERPMERRLEWMAQVYRAGRDSAPSSAMLLLSAEQAEEFKAGQPESLQVGDPPAISATRVRLDAQAQAVLGQVEALVEFPDPNQRYPTGAFVRVTFASGRTKPVFVVPESALLVAADGSYVYTINGTYLTRTRVRPGAASDGFVEIEDGLYAGDSVVTKGIDDLWLVELSALKGGTPCCAVPKKAR